MHLSPVDWLIMLVYFVFVLGIGFALKRYMRTCSDFFLAGSSIPPTRVPTACPERSRTGLP